MALISLACTCIHQPYRAILRLRSHLSGFKMLLCFQSPIGSLKSISSFLSSVNINSHITL